MKQWMVRVRWRFVELPRGGGVWTEATEFRISIGSCLASTATAKANKFYFGDACWQGLSLDGDGDVLLLYPHVINLYIHASKNPDLDGRNIQNLDYVCFGWQILQFLLFFFFFFF